MKIKAIKAVNYKAFHDINLEIGGQNTVIFGINGAGKSTVLEIVSRSFWNWINRINPSQGTTYRSLDIESLRAPAMEMIVQAEIVMNESNYVLGKALTRRGGKSSSTIADKNMYNSFIEDFEKMLSQEGRDIPVFINYGTNRSVLDVPVRIRKKHEFSQIAAYERVMDNALNFRIFFEWYRNQEDIQNEYIIEHQDIAYQDIALKCVRKAIETMMNNVSGLRVKRNPLSMRVKKDNTEIRVDQLSDGEKCTLALLGDIARRMAIANPNKDNPLDGTGIVLIDEIELHMHPAWQRRILKVLKEVFPNVQFIVTTHSPQILGELDDSYAIFALVPDGENGTLVNKVKRLDGFDSNYILEEFMQTNYRNEIFGKMITDAYALINNGKYDAAEKMILQIENCSSSESRDVILLKGHLKRSKLLNEKNH